MSFDVSVGVQRGAAIDYLERFAGSRVSEGVSHAETTKTHTIVTSSPIGVIAVDLKRPCIEFGVVRIDSAKVVCIHSAMIQLLLTRRGSYCFPAG